MHIPFSSVSMDGGVTYIDKMCRPNLHLNIFCYPKFFGMQNALLKIFNGKSRVSGMWRATKPKAREQCTNEMRKAKKINENFQEIKDFLTELFMLSVSFSLFFVGVFGEIGW